MALSDPFSTTYQGSFQAGQSLGQGIQSAAGSVADVMKQKEAIQQQAKQRKQSFDMLKSMGLIQEDTTPPSVDDLKTGLQVAGKTMGKDIHFNIASDADEKQQRDFLTNIYKSFNIPMPQGKTKTTISPGVSLDIGGGSSITGQKPDKTIPQQIAEFQVAQQMLGSSGIPTINAKGGVSIKSPNNAGKQDSVKYIADAIQNGDQLADFQSLYGLAGPVKAELEKRGINVSKMQLDTLAEKKFIQTLNSPAQTRLRQIIPSVIDGLDVLDGLNKEFERTGIKAFNKAKLESLANGAGTKEQQEAAAKFITQISVLSDEAGSLFMNGNTPTDKSIEVFQKIVQGDYNDTTINSAIKQLKVNLNIRKNAIENTGAVGISGPLNQKNSAQQTLNATPGMSVGKPQTQDNNDPLGLR